MNYQPGYLAGPNGNISSSLNVILDDSGATSVQSLNGTGGGGSYQASGSLAAFNTGAASGTWTLFLADMSGGDGGNISSLLSWGLQLDVVPEPTTWALLSFSVLLGLGLYWGRLTALWRRVNRWVDAV